MLFKDSQVVDLLIASLEAQPFWLKLYGFQLVRQPFLSGYQ